MEVGELRLGQETIDYQAIITNSLGPRTKSLIPITKRKRFQLPHWSQDGATYHAVFRLADSLPQTLIKSYIEELDRLESEPNLSASGEERLKYLKEDAVQQYLDSGHGSCLLKEPEVASITANTLKHFHGQRYGLYAWCVMPNHVHAVVQPCPPHQLGSILHSWKSFSSNQINKALGRSGQLWQIDSFDRIIRNSEEFRDTVEYVLSNPQMAGLSDWPWVGTLETGKHP